MKIPYHLLFVLIIALAACGSSRNVGTFHPIEKKTDTTKTVPKKVVTTPKKPQKEVKKALLRDEAPLTISLLLPLNITASDYKMASVIADYYEGILLGLDSLENMGIDVVLNVYDTKDDSATVKRITWKPELAQSHVIIGPTFKKGHALLLEYCKARKIALVSPFSNANMWSDSNHYALYCTPDENAIARSLAHIINNKYPKANLLLFNDNTQEDKDFIWRFKVAARKLGLDKWTDITYQSGWNIENHLKRGDSALNIIVAPTDKSRIALDLVTQLKDPEINNILFVRDAWLDFNNKNYQTYQLWQHNNLHILSHFFIDDQEANVIHFKTLYKEKFAAIPNEFAYRGFDHILTLGKAYYTTLAEETLADELEKNEYKGLHNNFRFQFNGKALENQSVNIIKFVDYRFLRVK